MRLAAVSSTIHKWLALIVGLPVLFWVVSGLFFAVYPIERVRSEHRMAQAEPASLDLAEIVPPSALVLEQTPTRLTLEQRLGGPMYVAEFVEGRSALIDARDGRLVSPLTSEAAVAAALAHLNETLPVENVTYIIEGSPEYRGPLPAWRVAFVDREGLAVYVAADTGRVAARRSDLWRIYDGLWAFHIMDWRDHENFNNALLVISAALALIVTIAGIILLPYRLRFRRKRG